MTSSEMTDVSYEMLMKIKADNLKKVNNTLKLKLKVETVNGEIKLKFRPNLHNHIFFL